MVSLQNYNGPNSIYVKYHHDFHVLDTTNDQNEGYLPSKSEVGNKIVSYYLLRFID